jgi:DNA primase
LPHILAADPAMTVYVCEGEKSAEMAVLIGLNATTSCQGAQSPGKTDWTPLVGRNVVILPDNDEPGRNYATKLLGLLSPLGVA